MTRIATDLEPSRNDPPAATASPSRSGRRLPPDAAESNELAATRERRERLRAARAERQQERMTEQLDAGSERVLMTATWEQDSR